MLRPKEGAIYEHMNCLKARAFRLCLAYTDTPLTHEAMLASTYPSNKPSLVPRGGKRDGKERGREEVKRGIGGVEAVPMPCELFHYT